MSLNADMTEEIRMTLVEVESREPQHQVGSHQNQSEELKSRARVYESMIRTKKNLTPTGLPLHKHTLKYSSINFW